MLTCPVALGAFGGFAGSFAIPETSHCSVCCLCLLQKQIDEAGLETLSPADKLYVVHVKQGKDTKERAWSAGGPLLPSLQMALARYPHSIIELEVLLAVALATHTCMCVGLVLA